MAKLAVMDSLIAAVSPQLVRVTRNEADFKEIPISIINSFVKCIP